MAGSRRPLHLIVEVHGFDSARQPTHQTISHHAVVQSAFAAVVRILEQWGQSEGAIPIGTKAKIKDTRDGGTVFEMTYLGYEQDTLIGR